MQIEFDDLKAIFEGVLKNRALELTPATTVNSMKMDSLDVLEITMSIEQQYGKDFDPSELSECETLADIHELVASQI